MNEETLYDVKLTLQQCIDLAIFLGDEGSERVEHLELAKKKGLDLEGALKGPYNRNVREIKLAKDVIKILIKTTGEQIVSKPVLKYLEKEEGIS